MAIEKLNIYFIWPIFAGAGARVLLFFNDCATIKLVLVLSNNAF